MLSISEIYNAVVLDDINGVENGDVNFERFNRMSKRAEMRMLDYISGDIENLKPPIPYDSQKLKDILSLYIKPFPVHVINGKITKPEDYYNWENAYLLGTSNNTTTCDEEADIPIVGCNTSIELLDGDKYYQRCNTYIEGLQPSFKRPIAKEVGNSFEFLPKDLGSITLEYIYLPIFGKIVSKFDQIYNQEIIDEDLSTNYSWPPFARELLVFWLTQMFSIHTREQALPQNNLIYGKLERNEK